MSDDYDTPWKEVVTRYFPEFMAFYFPETHAAIDWTRPHVFLDQELAALSRDATIGKRMLDKLVQVHSREHGAQWVLVHLEIQGRRESAFAERIFVYNYRIYDHYRRPVASLALLVDRHAHWRPTSFGWRLFNCRLQLDFPIVKIQDYADQIDDLLEQYNPFALVTVAHLLTRRTKGQAHKRRIAKWRLTKLLYQRDWDRQRIIDLYRVIDWIMRLPIGLEKRLRSAIMQLERRPAMAYLSSIERIGMEMGRQEGRQEGSANLLNLMLSERFGTLDQSTLGKLRNADAEQLARWGRNFIHANTLEAVFSEKSV